MHFLYFWENDRIQVLKEKIEYFEAIPFYIKEKIMCNFMFLDVFSKTAFQSFFASGREFDKSFAYEVTFGFMPRQFVDTV